jgi:hypothetical protein
MARVDEITDPQFKQLPEGEEIGMLTDFKELICQLNELGKYVASIEVAYHRESFRDFKRGIILFERDLKKFRLRMDRIRILNDRRTYGFRRAVVKVNKQLEEIKNEEDSEERSDQGEDRD